MDNFALYGKGFLIAFKGIPITLQVSVVALILGVILGLVLALMRTSKIKILKVISGIYIEIVRGTPMLVQALVAAYGIPALLQDKGIDFKWSQLIVPAMLVCGLNSAAYMAEVIRGGIQAVEKGQIEAAASLGMTKKQIYTLIVLPQAIRIVIPSFGNEFVTMIKETSVLSFVGVIEILRRAQLWNAATYDTFPAYIGAALVYLCLTIPLSRIVGRIEVKMSKGKAK
jgi:His/Glu/Gln/Arg/opine family amino acid ABC transporter permease subunit